MSLVFTQLAADSFVPDANPLNPANWTVASDYGQSLEALGGFCVQTAVNGCANLYTGAVFPNDQYAQTTLSAITTAADSVVVGVRVDPTGDTNGVFMNLIKNAGATLSVNVSDGTNALFSNAALPFTLGDVFKIAAIGTSVTAYQNGVLLTTVTPIIPSTGKPFLVIGAASSSSTKLSSFSAGSVTQVSTYSQPDCRNFGHFPNGSVNVNGTLTYTVQTSSNPAVPGTDSRKAGAPVMSSTLPQNSRTPGTFGPGE